MASRLSGSIAILAMYLFFSPPANTQEQLIETKLENPDEGYQDANIGGAISIDGEVMLLGAYYTKALGLSLAGEAFIYRRGPQGNWEKEADLIASDAAAKAYFGRAVGVSGDTAVVGAPRDSERAPQAGAAYIYVHGQGGWEEQAKLTGTAARDSLFGEEVLLQGDMAVIAAPEYGYSGYQYGSVYVFKRTNGVWAQHQRLVPPEPIHRGYFGIELAMTESTLLIGAARLASTAEGQGAIYVYERDDKDLWQQQAVILPADPEMEEFGGYPIAISGDSILATVSNGADDYAKVFVRLDNEWHLQATLSTEDLATDEEFGDDIAIHEETAFVSVSNVGDQEPVGAISVFERTGELWHQTNTIAAPEGLGGFHFGYSLHVDQHFVATGATSAVCVYPFSATTTWIPEDIVAMSEGASGDHFGDVVSIWGDTAVVGADADGRLGWGTGSANIFRQGPDGWAHSATLFAPDPALWDGFANAVAIFRDTLICSAQHAQDPEDKPGSIYVFERFGADDWAFSQKIKPSSSVPTQIYSFGNHIAMWDTTIVAGAPYASEIAPLAGTAFVFERDISGHWQQQAQFLPSDLTAGDTFGSAVAVQGRTIVVGAPFDSDEAVDAGAAYVFERNAAGVWVKTTRVKADVPAEHQDFGRTVAIDGGTIVVGAPGNSGEAAFVFTRNENQDWYLQAKLVTDEPNIRQHFGRTVAVRGRTIAVGGEGAVYLAPPGRLYIFRQDDAGEWTQRHVLSPADHELGDRFATALGFQQGRVIVGASDNDGPEVDSGAAYVYELNYPLYNVTFETDGTPGSSLQGQLIQIIDDGSGCTPVRALAPEGFLFDGWTQTTDEHFTGDSNSLIADGVLADTTYTAHFAPIQYTLRYFAGENGSLSGALDQIVNHGYDGAAVYAIGSEGYFFVRWNDGRQDNPRLDQAVTGDIAATAYFAPIIHVLTYTAGDHGHIEGPTNQNVPYAASGAPITAISDSGWRFFQWSDGTLENPRQDVNVTSDLTVSALFVPDSSGEGEEEEEEEEEEGEGEGEAEGEGGIHSGDLNGDSQIQLGELLRVIQFFNSDGLRCAASSSATEDGYIPGGGAQKTCEPHSSDYNPQDWKISLSELLRLVQFFNSGGYQHCHASEDGYCPVTEGAKAVYLTSRSHIHGRQIRATSHPMRSSF